MNHEEKILELLTNLTSDVSDIKTTLEEHGDRLGKIESTLEEHSDRLGKIESTLEEHSDRLLKLEMTQETRIIPSLQVLAEGHQTLLETLSPKSRVEALESDMSLVKTVLTGLSQRVSALENAD